MYRRINLIILLLLLVLGSCDEQELRFEKSYSNGEQIYQQNCAQCHQADGKGLGQLYPPIEGSDYLKLHNSELVCIIYKGLNSRIDVNGISYQQQMPGNASLSNAELAALLTYVRSRWLLSKEICKEEDVSGAMIPCKGIDTP